MTQIVLKNSIDNMQMGVLMGLFNSWNLNVEITDEKKSEHKSFSQLFSKTRGMWQDYGMETAAERLCEDYTTDKNLTAFTNLDCEDFYETR